MKTQVVRLEVSDDIDEGGMGSIDGFKETEVGRIPVEWKLLTVEEVCEKIIDYRGKTPKKRDSGIPLITAKIVKNGRILEPNEFIAIEDYDSWMQRGLPNRSSFG